MDKHIYLLIFIIVTSLYSQSTVLDDDESGLFFGGQYSTNLDVYSFGGGISYGIKEVIDIGGGVSISDEKTLNIGKFTSYSFGISIHPFNLTKDNFVGVSFGIGFGVTKFDQKNVKVSTIPKTISIYGKIRTIESVISPLAYISFINNNVWHQSPHSNTSSKLMGCGISYKLGEEYESKFVISPSISTDFENMIFQLELGVLMENL